MRLDRMLGITLELMTKRRVTATELAARFEVSIRTVYRDIELINQAGIPVASFAGTDGGFELMDGFFLTKQHFSVDDFAVIYNLLKSMEGAVGGKLTTLKNKLGSLHPALANGGCDDKLIFDMSASEGERAIIHPLYNAIHQSKRVAFSYTGASGTVSERRVEPVRLYWERGVWYLEGYCLLRHGIRFFRITRMTKFHVSEEVFQPREASTETPPETTDGMQVHLRFDLNAQPRVFEQFPGECVHQGTHIDVHTTCYSTEYALSIVLSYGSKAVIVSPDELKRAFIDELKEMQKRYVQNDGEEK
ncbi:YafY family protein [Paenibacillus sp. MSJ-34]|uniref:helix-turn-helix transcriptional regulator n=1 Tax=Paenibacillus sp. MSJ-34 TaxID=2841529 RepID=UPI001C0FCB0C|nr:YafY family protein [Paenibacillus sp. MSJ-34]MBU5442720.1 YafY family transcriptional regulator [Paenibacillus sp. MSJ-34]